MSKFEHAQTKVFPSLVGEMHPHKPCISEQIENVNDGYRKEQGSNTALSVDIKDGNRSNENDHRLKRSTCQYEIDADKSTIGHDQFCLERVFCETIGHEPLVAIPIVPQEATF